MTAPRTRTESAADPVDPDGTSDRLLDRLAAFEVLSELSGHVASSLDLEQVLHRVAQAVVDHLGFEVAVLNIATDSGLEVMAVAGPEEARRSLAGTCSSHEAWQALLHRSTALGGLRFVDGRQDTVWEVQDWVPDIPLPREPDGWHPMDALFAPLESAELGLLGVLSVDLPRDRRRPGPQVTAVLRRFADQAVLAVERARTTEGLEESVELFSRVFEGVPQGLALLDADGRLLRANPACVPLLAGRRPVRAGTPAWALVHAADARGVQAALEQVRTGSLQSFTGLVRSQDGGRQVSLRLSRLRTGRTVRVLAQVEDVTERRRLEEQLRRDALTDPLTGLANRAGLDQQLDALLARGGGIAVLFCDLDHFKVVNDTYGHAVGDGLLRQSAARLRETLRPGDVAARLGGDELVVVLTRAADEEQVLAVAERVRERLTRPLHVDGVDLLPSVSVGVAVSGEGKDGGELMAEADAAVYGAKQQGRNRVCAFSPLLLEPAHRRRELRRELHDAIDGGQLRLHYQPIVDLRSRAVLGHEALVRWQHPTRGLLGPDDFLRSASRGQLEDLLTDWVLDTALADLVRLSHRDRFVSVNIGPPQLDRRDLVVRVADALERHGVPPGRLWLEVTEHDDVRGPRQLETLRELGALGVTVVIDDFGSGYAGLLWLRDVPASVVKLDRDLVAEVLTDAPSRIILESVTALAERLGLRVVAEGIETPEQLDALIALGVACGQGWHVGRPTGLDDEHREVLEPDVVAAAVRARTADARTVEELAASAVACGVALLGAAAGTFVVREPGARDVRVLHAVGYSSEAVDRFRVFPLDAPLPLATCLRLGQAQYLEPDPTRQLLSRLTLPSPPAQVSLAAVPVPGSGGACAAVGLSWYELPVLTPSLRAAAEALAGAVGERLADLEPVDA